MPNEFSQGRVGSHLTIASEMQSASYQVQFKSRKDEQSGAQNAHVRRKIIRGSLKRQLLQAFSGY